MVSLRWLRLAAVASAAGVGVGPAGRVDGGAAPSDLTKLQELLKELEPVSPPLAPNRTASVVAPKPIKGQQMVSLKAGVPNADTGDDSVLVFEEAEKSVEKALRRLAPSPGPIPAGGCDADCGLIAPSVSKIYYCTECTKFENGAEDGAGSKMCLKTSPPVAACYQDINGCPSDMTAYTCNTTAAGSDADGTADLDAFLMDYDLSYLATTLRNRAVTLSQITDMASPMGTFLYDGQSDRRSAFAAAVPLASEEADSLFAAAEAKVATDGVCTAARVLEYQVAKAEALVLMTKLIELKKLGETLLTAMVDDSLKSGVNMIGRRLADMTGTCPCEPWEKTVKAFGAS